MGVTSVCLLFYLRTPCQSTHTEVVVVNTKMSLPNGDTEPSVFRLGRTSPPHPNITVNIDQHADMLPLYLRKSTSPFSSPRRQNFKKEPSTETHEFAIKPPLPSLCFSIVSQNKSSLAQIIIMGARNGYHIL